MYQHLLVATDGSKLSAKAVAHAIVLAKELGAKLTAFLRFTRLSDADLC
jgi:nucleotide-binding universal stress UspA family protein